MNQGEWRACYYSNGLTGCVTSIGLFFLFLVGFAHSHPGRTPSGQLLPALAVFAFFGLMGIYSAWQMRRARVLWNDREIRSRSVIIPWEELQGANFLEAAHAYQLHGVNGQKIWIYKAMTGFPEFWKKVEELLDLT